MPDLDFTVEKAVAVGHAASPLLNFSLRVTDKHGMPIHSVALRCQIRIEPARRQYKPEEEQRLLDLFGPPSRWGQTLRTMLWTHTSVIVPPFTGATVVNLPVPCTYDFNIAAAKFFYALADGEVPLCLLFNGTVFYATEDGSLQVEQISWEKEASFRLAVRVWKEMMEMYYPNSAWLCVHKDTFDRLYQYKSSHSLPTWEAAIEKLLDETNDRVMT
jgi:Family of unknown function (DUF6084)